MNYDDHKDNPKSFRALTGLDQLQFSDLLPYIHCLIHILGLSLETMGLVPTQTDKELSARLSELSKNDNF